LRDHGVEHETAARRRAEVAAIKRKQTGIAQLRNARRHRRDTPPPAIGAKVYAFR